MQVLQINQAYSITKKGQVTIPLQLRKKLGLETGSEVVFEEAKGIIKIVPALSTLRSVYGSVKPLKKKTSFNKMKQIALEEKFNAIR